MWEYSDKVKEHFTKYLSKNFAISKTPAKLENIPARIGPMPSVQTKSL